MGIDGIIILDALGHPIIQSGFRSKPAAYTILHIDAYTNAASKYTRAQDIDPVLFVPSYGNSETSSACCHVAQSDVRFLCPITGDVDPLFAFAFLQAFMDVLRDYFGNISAGTIRENFDVVYQLLEETLDSGGHPQTTSSNALRDIVLPPSLLSKLLSVAGANINSSITSGSGTGPFTSPIPWRKAGLKYTSNEIYFDMVEEYKAIVNKHGTPVSCNVWGHVEANAKLSGTPDLLLTFTNPHVLTDCAFHSCVRLPRWTRDKTLSFVPPDGKFVLFDYRYSPGASATSQRLLEASNTVGSIGKDVIALPFTIKSFVELNQEACTFDFTLTSRTSAKSLENVVVDFYLGEGATGVKCVVARAGGGGGGGGFVSSRARAGGLGALPAGESSWSFDPKKRVLRWEIASAAPSSSWTMRGSFSSSLPTPRPAHALQVKFDIPSYTFSALKVEQLKVTGEAYKPYKGVRGRATGDVEWRW